MSGKILFVSILSLAPTLTAFVFSTAISGSPSIRLAQPLPSVVRQQQLVRIDGAVARASRASRAELELRPTLPHPAKTWTVVVHTPLGPHGRFELRWRVPASQAREPLSLRVVAVARDGAQIAATRARQSFVGPPYIACKPPVPPMVNIPVGDGWIVGGAYGIGGAFPGIDECLAQQYTVTATGANGKVQATQTVAGGHSYTLAPLPAGRYTLRAGACMGTATVAAGKQTAADADCLYP
jgi:hypothetical protein